MAIVAADVFLWRRLKELNAIPPTPRVLEIGEANWFMDLDPATVPEFCGFFDESGDVDPFIIAKEFYCRVLNPCTMLAVDQHGTPAAIKADLNRPLPLSGLFGICINSGTLEHVFNVAQAFESIHSLTEIGGLMIHASPLSGWERHGFYLFGLNFWEDLAAANEYETLVKFTYDFHEQKIYEDCSTGIGNDMMTYIAWKKIVPHTFRVPWQGRYAK